MSLATLALAGGIMVFAPTLLLTVTLEIGPSKQDELHLHAGGQGFWVARMIRSLGLRAALAPPIGGETGRVLRRLVDAEAIDLEAAPIAGASGAYVHDRRQGSRVSLASIPGAELARHEADNLYEAALLAGLEAGTAVLTGAFWPVFPNDYYRRLTLDLRANGCTVIADVAGAVLEPVLAGGVDVLKISSEELVKHGIATGEDDGHVLTAIAELVAGGAKSVVVSRAAEPALVWSRNRLWKVIVPRLEPADYRLRRFDGGGARRGIGSRADARGRHSPRCRGGLAQRRSSRPRHRQPLADRTIDAVRSGS